MASGEGSDIVQEDNRLLMFARVGAGMLRNLDSAGQLMLARAQQHLSGRSGDSIGVDTGALLNSLEVIIELEPQGVSAVVRSNDPMQRAILSRLTRGFTGTDARGHTYNQAPVPALEHAHDETLSETMELAGRRLW